MRALVTGGAGFIGHHLVGALLARGDDVRVIDDLSTGSRERLSGFGDRVAFIAASIDDPNALDEAAAGCEVIFHQAAIASVARSLVDPVGTNQVNVGGTIQVMLAAERQGVSRVIFAGSSAVYGVPPTLPCRESMRADPRSPYGASKLAAEHYLHTLGEAFGIDTVVLRYFNVFGPGQDPSSEYAAVVPRFITAVLEGRPPVIYGQGDITRDFIYVENVVRANLSAASSSSPSGLTCNVAAGERTSLLELLAAISIATGREAVPTYGPARPGDIKDSHADVSVAMASLGYEVSVPFAEGVERTVEWYLNA